MLGEGLVIAEGDAHIHQRKALSPGFSVSSVNILTSIFWRKSLLLSTLWSREIEPKMHKTKYFEISDSLNCATLDMIGEAGFETAFGCLENPQAPIHEAYRSAFALNFKAQILLALSLFSSIPNYFPSRMKTVFLKTQEIVADTASGIVRENCPGPNGNDKSLISLIINANEGQPAKTERPGFQFMRDQVMTFIGAGHESTATGVAWALHLLSKHPAMQHKLREEIREYMPSLFFSSSPSNNNNNSPSDHLTSIDPSQLPYLHNIWRESLRYTPPVPVSLRQLLAADHLGGYLIPAGTIVHIHTNAIHRLTRYWGPNPNAFDPDRWDHLPDTWTPNVFLPFLNGPRGCIGKKFAEIEMKILLVVLMSRFRFEQADEGVKGGNPEEHKMWRLILKPRDGIVLKVGMLG